MVSQRVPLAIMGSLFGVGSVDRQRASETDPESCPTVEKSCARVAICNTTDDVQHGFCVEVSQSSINCCQSTFSDVVVDVTVMVIVIVAVTGWGGDRGRARPGHETSLFLLYIVLYCIVLYCIVLYGICFCLF